MTAMHAITTTASEIIQQSQPINQSSAYPSYRKLDNSSAQFGIPTEREDKWLRT